MRWPTVLVIVAAALIVPLYFVPVDRQPESPFGGVHSGPLEAAAEWAAKRVKLARGTAQRG